MSLTRPPRGGLLLLLLLEIGAGLLQKINQHQKKKQNQLPYTNIMLHYNQVHPKLANGRRKHLLLETILSGNFLFKWLYLGNEK